jgi:2,3-bisphosphoglycerate-independent phosphoglycerate mutase
MKRKKVILLILDGWGQGEENVSNPFRLAKTPTFNYLQKNFPFCLLNASGYAVGLSSFEPGNCEIGHLTIGTGIVYYQPVVKINLAIENKEFFKNEILLNIFDHCQKFNSKLHLITLLSKSNQISDFNHLIAVLELCKEKNFNNVYLHLFTDGIDSPHKSALSLIEKLETYQKTKNLPGKIATLCGRFYSLDTTGDYFLKTQRAFLLLFEGKGNLINDLKNFLSLKYKEKDFNDDILEPIVLDTEGIIKDNDAILFLIHENKYIYQLANSFLNPNFQEFKRPQRENLFITSLVRYLDVDYPVIFEKQKILTHLTKIISENNLKQIKIIDEKNKALFKYYFNGFVEEEHPGEIFKILPSFSDDINILKEQIKEFFNFLEITIKESLFDVIIANLSVFNTIGHTGNFNLAIQVIEEVDKYLKNLIDKTLENGYSLILTSDHGKIEKMINFKTGKKYTENTLNPVPFILVDKDYFKEKTTQELIIEKKKIRGSLVDIAPTILELLNIPIPSSFMGKSLLNFFK